MTTIQDIKKALEICSEDDGCRECPYYDYHHCDKALLKDALALIIGQVVEQNQKYQEQRIKQAKIDILNKLKERVIGYTFLGEKLATETDIDELIKKVENE
ncbi:MAG: hypothetical protein MSH08_01805 [Ezakiella sp.]|nr:hypothetical protein [Ezakiella sp.]